MKELIFFKVNLTRKTKEIEKKHIDVLIRIGLLGHVYFCHLCVKIAIFIIQKLKGQRNIANVKKPTEKYALCAT
jgi:hypothetical protein